MGIIVIYQKQKRSGIKNLTVKDGQKIIDKNLGMLRERWDRIQKEKDSGLLKTVGWWYFDEATEPQMRRIKNIGISLQGEKITKGQASDIIGLFESAEPRDLEVLKRHNISIEGMNETKAREVAAKLRQNPKELEKLDLNPNREIENRTIREFPNDFIYFVRFFSSRERDDAKKPSFVPEDYNKRYKQAVYLGLSKSGEDIPLEEKLKTLKLKELGKLADDQKFTRKAKAIEYLMEIPDIKNRFDSVFPNKSWFQLKEVKLDLRYLEDKWKEISGNND